jgi:hypothetical protein
LPPWGAAGGRGGGAGGGRGRPGGAAGYEGMVRCLFPERRFGLRRRISEARQCVFGFGFFARGGFAQRDVSCVCAVAERTAGFDASALRGRVLLLLGRQGEVEGVYCFSLRHIGRSKGERSVDEGLRRPKESLRCLKKRRAGFWPDAVRSRWRFPKSARFLTPPFHP